MSKQGAVTISRGLYTKILAKVLADNLDDITTMLGGSTPKMDNLKILLKTLQAGECPALESCKCYEYAATKYPVFCMEHSAPVLGVASKFIIVMPCPSPEHPSHHIASAYGMGTPVYVHGEDTLQGAEEFLDGIDSEEALEEKVNSFSNKRKADEMAAMLEDMKINKEDLPN